MNWLSKNIRTLRRRYCWTQDDLAKRLDVKRSLVGAWEEGRTNPKYDILHKLVDVFNLKIDDPTLLFTEEIKPGQVPVRKVSAKDEKLWKAIADIRKILNELPNY